MPHFSLLSIKILVPCDGILSAWRYKSFRNKEMDPAYLKVQGTIQIPDTGITSANTQGFKGKHKCNVMPQCSSVLNKLLNPEPCYLFITLCLSTNFLARRDYHHWTLHQCLVQCKALFIAKSIYHFPELKKQ